MSESVRQISEHSERLMIEREVIKFYFEHYAHQETVRLQHRNRLDYLYFRKHGVMMPTNIERVTQGVHLGTTNGTFNDRRIP